MMVEIDVNKIAEGIDVSKLVKERIVSDIENNSRFEDVVGELLENEEVKNKIERKIVDIIDEFLSSDEGKEYIIKEFKSEIDYSDVLSGSKVEELIVSILKRSLNME